MITYDTNIVSLEDMQTYDELTANTIYNERLDTCDNCPDGNLQVNNPNDQSQDSCKLCGCKVEKLAQGKVSNCKGNFWYR